MERIFLCGLKARDPALRARFLALYTDAIPRNIHQRLKFCVESQDWEALAGTFWLQHAVAIHLDIVRTEGALYIAQRLRAVAAPGAKLAAAEEETAAAEERRGNPLASTGALC